MEPESAVRSVRFYALGIVLASICVFALHSAEAATATSSTGQTPAPFLTNLALGSTDPDVARLQTYLNTNGYAVASSGPGSPGQETTYFGQLTRAALMRFQQQYAAEILVPLGLSAPTGNLYGATRSFINNRLSVQDVITEATTTPAGSVRRGGGSRRSSSSEPGTVVITVTTGVGTSLPPSQERTVVRGQAASITVTALTGYDVSAVVGGTCPAGTWNGTIYSTGTITEPCSISFSAELEVYEVSILSNSVTPHGDVEVAYGSTVSFTVDDAYGYGLGTIGGTCPEGTWHHATYVTGSITGPCSIEFTQSVMGLSVGSTLVASDDIYLRQVGYDLQYSLDRSTWNVAAGVPAVVNSGLDTLNVWLLGDFSFNSANAYFMAASDNIAFRGEPGPYSPTVVSIVDVSNYPGLFQNGTQSDVAYDNVTISDVFVNAVSSTLANGAGWVAQAYFGVGATGGALSGVASNGDIAQSGGGVVGQFANELAITDAFSLGDIGIQAGGIVGEDASEVTVADAYSLGAISTRAGGIFGATATQTAATNAYSTGSLASEAGGIYGADARYATASHVYVAGIDDGMGDIFFGDGSNNYTVNAGVSERAFSSFGWHDSSASLTLAGIGDTWISYEINQPYRLSRFAAALYADPTQDVARGGTSTAGNGYYAGTFALVWVSSDDDVDIEAGDFTINETTGVVTVSATADPGDYRLIVSGQSANGVPATSALMLAVE